MHGRDREPTAGSGSGEQRGTSFANPEPRESDSGLNIHWYEMWLHSLSIFVAVNMPTDVMFIFSTWVQ